jgi:hypothetical protein
MQATPLVWNLLLGSVNPVSLSLSSNRVDQADIAIVLTRPCFESQARNIGSLTPCTPAANNSARPPLARLTIIGMK